MEENQINQISSIEFEKMYTKFLLDEDVNSFDLLSKNPNIFNILGVQNLEIKHSNFLSWLLDPNQNHGLDSDLLYFLLVIISTDIRSGTFSATEIPRINFQNVNVYREWRNIDILIVLEEFVLIIENKINANESEGQLLKYKEIVEENFKGRKSIFIFLTIEGYESSENETYINISHKRIIDFLENYIQKNTVLNLKSKSYIQDYILNYRNIMGESDISILASKIYENHSLLLEEVFKYRKTQISLIKDLINEKIKGQNNWIIKSNTKSLIKFTTSNLESRLPKTIAKSGEENESFFFEIYFYQTGNLISVYCSVPSSENEIRQKLLSILENSSSRKFKSESEGVRTFKSKNIKINSDKTDEEYTEEILNIINKLVNEIEPLILRECKI